MRNPERIPEIIEALAKVWMLVPDWRLGQLIINLSGNDGAFQVEDDELLRRIKIILEGV